MNVSLTPRLEKMVKKKVASGLYNSASEVIREALRMFEEKERSRELKLKELRKEIAIGTDQLKRGESIPGEDVFNHLHMRNKKLSKQIR